MTYPALYSGPSQAVLDAFFQWVFHGTPMPSLPSTLTLVDSSGASSSYTRDPANYSLQNLTDYSSIPDLQLDLSPSPGSSFTLRNGSTVLWTGTHPVTIHNSGAMFVDGVHSDGITSWLAQKLLNWLFGGVAMPDLGTSLRLVVGTAAYTMTEDGSTILPPGGGSAVSVSIPRDSATWTLTVDFDTTVQYGPNARASTPGPFTLTPVPAADTVRALYLASGVGYGDALFGMYETAYSVDAGTELLVSKISVASTDYVVV